MQADKDTVCVTMECNETVKQIEGQMGNSTACDNFYNYVCGKWNGDKELVQAELKKKALEDLVSLLDSAVQPTSEELNATDKFIDAYKSCTERAQDEEALRNSTKRILGPYGLGDWPIVEDGNTSESRDSYRDILQRTGLRPLFRSYVSTDHSSEPIIFMTVPSTFYVSSLDYDEYQDYTDSPNELQAEEREDGTSGTNITRYVDYSEAAYKEFIKEAILLLAPAQKQGADDIAEQIILFEKNLSQIHMQARKETKNMTLKELTQKLDNKLPMQKVLQKDFDPLNITINNDTEVKVEYLEYYQKVVEFLGNATSTVPLRNYILWTWVRSMSEAEGTKLHKFYLEYKNKTATIPGEEKPPSNDTRMPCLLQLLQTDVMYSAGAAYYAKAKFDEAAKENVLKIMKFINVTFLNVIVNNTWMSEYVKEQATKRLAGMKLVIGYPDWIMNSSLMDSLYQFVPRIDLGASFVEHYQWLNENERLQKLLKLNSSYFTKENENVTLRSHAYYAETTDTLAYPAAALVTHYRNPEIPRALNFGTIGTILVQLLTQAIDKFNDQIEQGKKTKHSFWDNDTTTKFCNRSLCLNNTEECSDVGCPTLKYERLHDYFGVRVSHLALERSKENYSDPFLLPGVKFNTEDKIFFYGFGSLYCPYRVNENKVQSRADLLDESFPNSLNEIVAQYHDFNTTFNCSGNVVDTCTLMPPERTSRSQVC